MSLLPQSHSISIEIEGKIVKGDLAIPEEAIGLVLFVHGSGSSRMSPRNQYVARALNQACFSTLLFDLLTKEEEEIDIFTAEFRFDIRLLTNRLIKVTEWIKENSETKNLNIGYFGASTGAAAALLAAAQLPKDIKAIVSRGGRPDLADAGLKNVKAPTLLIVGGEDYPVIQMNSSALEQLPCEKKMVIVPGATHLFEEPGKLEKVAELAQNWFREHLTR